MDFDHASNTLTFGACNTLQCTEIVIVDDMMLELTESFSVTLERTAGLDNRITLDRVDVEVEITDDDGAYIVFTDMDIYALCFMWGLLRAQKLLWVWRGHPTRFLRMWVWWACVLSYLAPISLVPLITLLKSDSQLMMVVQVYIGLTALFYGLGTHNFKVATCTYFQHKQ